MTAFRQIPTKKLLLILMGLHLLVKLVFMFGFGPQYVGDSAYYYHLAQQILSWDQELFRVDLEKVYLPASAQRLPGYSLLMALL